MLLSEECDSYVIAMPAKNSFSNKLEVNTIDLYYLPRPDAVTPIEVSVGAMANLVKEGKVK
jgi:aryl-alcohol dehydrogenase-like predicted oxidoreductase